MQKAVAALAVLLLVGTTPGGAWAEKEVKLEGTVKLFSSFYTEDEKNDLKGVHEAGDFALNRGEFRLGLNGYASEKVSFRTRVDFIYSVLPEYSTLRELESGSGFSSAQHETEVYLREASFKVADLFTPGLDLTVGRQRVRWGTSDEYNVLDNLNPVDFGNIFSFDPDYFVEHLTSDGFNLEYQLPGDWSGKLQAVYFLAFKPSTLPTGFENSLKMEAEQDLAEGLAKFGMSGGAANIYLREPPAYRLDNGPCGARLSGKLLKFDLGLSYYRGYQSLPLPDEVNVDLTAETPTLNSYYDYPRLQVAGFDLAGEIASIGVWAEFGAFFPEERSVPVTTTTSAGPVGESTRLLKSSYYKYTVGGDYTFGIGNGLYLNVQYNHGFYDEFSFRNGIRDASFMGELEDYYIAQLKYAFLVDELIMELTYMQEVATNSDFPDKSAWLLNPEIEYKPFDGVSLVCGYTAVDGNREESKFGSFSHTDAGYTLLKAQF